MATFTALRTVVAGGLRAAEDLAHGLPVHFVVQHSLPARQKTSWAPTGEEDLDLGELGELGMAGRRFGIGCDCRPYAVRAFPNLVHVAAADRDDWLVLLHLRGKWVVVAHGEHLSAPLSKLERHVRRGAM